MDFTSSPFFNVIEPGLELYLKKNLALIASNSDCLTNFYHLKISKVHILSHVCGIL